MLPWYMHPLLVIVLGVTRPRRGTRPLGSLVRGAGFVIALSFALVPQAQAAVLSMFQTNDGAVLDGQFGFAIAVVGDMDGDGSADYAVGASFDSLPGPAAGRVFIFRGGAEHFGEPPAWTIDGLPGDLLGRSLAPAGDQDGDGLADLLIGAPGAAEVNPQVAGRVLIAYGSTPLGVRPTLMLIGTHPGERFGYAVAASDLDGDGDREIAVGAPGFNQDAGAVHVYRSEISGPVPIFTLHGREIGDEFGAAVANAGPTRAGPYSDLLIGAPFRSDFIFFWNGEASLYFGGAPPDTVCDMAWQGSADGDFFADALAGAGDVNGDGRADFLIGSPGANLEPDIDVGRFDLYLGETIPPLWPAVTGFGNVQFGDLGSSLAGVGDTDFDGFADFAIGLPGSPDAMIPGEVRFHRGRANPSAVPDTVLVGEVVDDMFGHAVSNGGPVLGNPFDLFLVGSYLHAGTGRVYLFGTGGGRVNVPSGSAAPSREMWLAPPWPNPARTRITLAFELERPAAVSLAVLDIAGRTVATLAHGAAVPGRHEFHWPQAIGSRPPSGIYWAVLDGPRQRETRRFVLLGD